MTRATALLHASTHRLARGLDAEQLATLVQHSRRNCERCDEYGSVYEQHTQGADPTTWQLCSLCHPSANTLSLWLDEGYADFLTEPLAATYEAHVRKLHEDDGWLDGESWLDGENPEDGLADRLERSDGTLVEPWGFHAALSPEEAIAPALASEQRRQAMLDEADGSEPELERLRRLPRQGEPTGPSKADIAAACEQLSRELSSPEMAAALARCDELLSDPQLCPNCDARMSGKRCYSCGLEQL